MDITLAPGPDGQPLAHDPGCPEVLKTLREGGGPVMHLFEIDGGLDKLTCAKHACLTRERSR